MKIAVSMRGDWLGPRKWMKEDAEAVAESGSAEAQERKKRRKKKK